MLRINQIFNFRKSINLLFSIVVIIGLSLRVYLILTRNVVIDELAYTSTARINSFFNLFLMNNWLRDHGFLPLIYLKITQLITLNIILLRLSNLIIYLILSISLFFFFNKFNKTLSVILIFLLSFLPYFIYINAYISPYNFVMFFSILAFISISNFIFFSKTTYRKIINAVLFLLFSVLAFYSDYSVIYFYLSLVPLIFFIFRRNEKMAENIILLGFLNFILLIPGLYQLSVNFKYFFNLNNGPDYLNYNFFAFLYNFANVFLLNFSMNISLIAIIFFLLLQMFIFTRVKNQFFQYLCFFSSTGLILNILFFYYFNKSYFYIFEERIFWYFYLLLILGLTTVFASLIKTKKMFLAFLVLVIIFCGFKYQQMSQDVNFVGLNISYEQIVNILMHKTTSSRRLTIILYDDGYNYRVLRDYYFNGFYKLNSEKSIKVKSFFRNQRILVIKSIRELNNLDLKSGDKTFFIIFDLSNENFALLKNTVISYNVKNKVKIVDLFYRLRCSGNICSFYKIL